MKVEVIKTPTLYRLIEDFRESLAIAADQCDWVAALDATLSGLLWRSVRLATRLSIIPPSFEPGVSWKLTALQLRSLCSRAAKPIYDEEADYRIEVVSDVLNALIDVAAALESGQAKTNDGAFRLTISAANLGRCELVLGLAEEGFWEQVYEWRRRQGGKPKGKGMAPWKAFALPVVRGWVEANPTIPITDLEDMLVDWLRIEKGHHIEKSTAKSAIGVWRENGKLPLPIRRNARS